MKIMQKISIIFLMITLRINGQYQINCPRNQLKFEKVIGVRPSRTEFYKLLYRSPNANELSAITRDCYKLCMARINCTNFILFYNLSECYEYINQNANLKISNAGIKTSSNLVADLNVSIFIKICLSAPLECKVKLWPTERVPGSVLVSDYSRQFSDYTRTQCAQQCINEKTFECRSAVFKTKESHMNISINNENEQFGICFLTKEDRHTKPNAFRVSGFDSEYIENQCVSDQSKAVSEYCSYEEYEEKILQHVDMDYYSLTRTECQEKCENEIRFKCHGYSIIPENESQQNLYSEFRYKCLIHSEDIHILGPKSLTHLNGAKYYQRTGCLNLTITCSSDHMRINYNPEQKFHGRMYLKGYSENKACYVNGKGSESLQLKIMVLNRACGIKEARSIGTKNRTLLSGLLIIQYNFLIQAQGDRLIKVGCLLNSDNNQIPRNVTIGTVVNFNSSDLPNRGSVVINDSSILPIVRMHVTDAIDNQEATDVQIGQELELRIEIEPPNGPYDIWAGHLIASTENGHDSILLLDEVGCPTNPSIFPTLKKIQTETMRTLTGRFQAFKFATSPVVKFSVLVQFCTLSCIPANCDNYKHSFGKHKRNIPNEIPTSIFNFEDKEGKILANLTEVKNETLQSNEIPLQFVIIVHSHSKSPDRLIYGDNKILVAGYDLSTNEVCFDYSLLIGLLITWLIIQLIILLGCIMLIRRYKKFFDIAYEQHSLNDFNSSFGLSSNFSRRVHWADKNNPLE